MFCVRFNFPGKVELLIPCVLGAVLFVEPITSLLHHQQTHLQHDHLQIII